MIKKYFFHSSKSGIKFFDHLRINLGILQLKKIFFELTTGKYRFLIFWQFTTVKKNQKTFQKKKKNFVFSFLLIKKKFKFFLPLYNFLKLTNFRSFALLGVLNKDKDPWEAQVTHEASQNSKKIENRSTLMYSILITGS